MGNYADLHFDNGTYVPQYAGAPLEEIKDTAKELSTRHYSSLANASQLQILANQMKASLLPGAKSHVDTHIQALDQALQEIATQGGENYTPKLNALATALQSDQGILDTSLRAKEYGKQTELIDQLKARGETPVFDEERRNAILNAPADSELYKTPYSSEVEPYKDPLKAQDEIWKVLHPNLTEGLLHPAPGTRESQLMEGATRNEGLDPYLFFESITKGGLSGTKIGEQLENAWTSYKNTPEYKQQMGPLAGKHSLLAKKTEDQLKEDLLRRGLMSQFETLQREYRPTPAAELKAGKEQVQLPAAVAPANKILDRNVKYNKTGSTRTVLENGDFEGVDWGKAATTEVGGPSGSGTMSTEDQQREDQRRVLDPQFIKDGAAAMSIYGVNPNRQPGPGTKSPKSATPADQERFLRTPEGRALVEKYNKERELRVSNSWLNRYDKKAAADASDVLQREFSMYEYLDEDGNVFRDTDIDKFKKVTGGDPSKFQVQGDFDPKNPFAQQTKNANFVSPQRVTAVIGSGDKAVTKTFIVGRPAGATDLTAQTINKIFYDTNMSPGQDIKFKNGVIARKIEGKQIEEDGGEDGSYPIAMSIPGYKGGQTILYPDAEHAAARALQQGYPLTVDQE